MRLSVALVSVLVLGLSGCAPSTAASPTTSAAAPSDGPSPPVSTPTASATTTPSPAASASARPSPDASGIATRVTIAQLEIDLPVVEPIDNTTKCDVAHYIPELHQPGQPGAVYLYANARAGMFLPLLTASQTGDGSALIGLEVGVYTSSNWLFRYRINELRHTPTSSGLTDAMAATTPQLWLQTGEGPLGTPTILQVIALPVDAVMVEEAAAHPEADPVSCQ